MPNTPTTLTSAPPSCSTTAGMPMQRLPSLPGDLPPEYLDQVGPQGLQQPSPPLPMAGALPEQDRLKQLQAMKSQLQSKAGLGPPLNSADTPFAAAGAGGSGGPGSTADQLELRAMLLRKVHSGLNMPGPGRGMMQPGWAGPQGPGGMQANGSSGRPLQSPESVPGEEGAGQQGPVTRSGRATRSASSGARR